MILVPRSTAVLALLRSRSERRVGQSHGIRTHQEGTALVVALVLLLVLTVIGLQGMRSTSVEENMAGNSQEAVRAFQAAESGLASASREILERVNANDFDPPAATVGTGASALTHDPNVTFVDFKQPGVGTGYDPKDFQAILFEAESVGTTAGNVERTHVAGYYRIVPKP